MTLLLAIRLFTAIHPYSPFAFLFHRRVITYSAVAHHPLSLPKDSNALAQHLTALSIIGARQHCVGMLQASKIGIEFLGM